MILHTIKNLLRIKDILKTLPSSRISNYIKIRFLESKDNVLEKWQ